MISSEELFIMFSNFLSLHRSRKFQISINFLGKTLNFSPLLPNAEFNEASSIGSFHFWTNLTSFGLKIWCKLRSIGKRKCTHQSIWNLVKSAVNSNSGLKTVKNKKKRPAQWHTSGKVLSLSADRETRWWNFFSSVQESLRSGHKISRHKKGEFVAKDKRKQVFKKSRDSKW